MDLELQRQRECLEMIASENFLDDDLISASGNPFTNKYAEGLAYKRYYGGCEYVDQMETLAISRACRLFSCDFANVQPHSGASANASVMLALLKPNDVIMGMDLAHGGHLTHGSAVNFSGSLYKPCFYQLDLATETLNYDKILENAKKHQPKLIIAGASAYPRIIDFAKFKAIAKEVGAYLMVDMAHIAGLVACNLHPSPMEHADVVTTTTHKTLRGPRGGLILWNNSELTKKLNKGVFPGSQGGPLEHTIAIKAACFLKALNPAFKTYQKNTIDNAQAFANQLIDLKKNVVSGGTDNHLILLSLKNYNITGKDLQNVLDIIGITANKNTIPNDQRSPFETSGVRFGTPAITTRKLKTKQMLEVAQIVSETVDILENYKTKKSQTDFSDFLVKLNTLDDFSHLSSSLFALKQKVNQICKKFPLYENWS